MEGRKKGREEGRLAEQNSMFGKKKKSKSKHITKAQFLDLNALKNKEAVFQLFREIRRNEQDWE